MNKLTTHGREVNSATNLFEAQIGEVQHIIATQQGTRSHVDLFSVHSVVASTAAVRGGSASGYAQPASLAQLRPRALRQAGGPQPVQQDTTAQQTRNGKVQPNLKMQLIVTYLYCGGEAFAAAIPP